MVYEDFTALNENINIWIRNLSSISYNLCQGYNWILTFPSNLHLNNVVVANI